MKNVTRRLLKVMSGTLGPIKIEYRSDPESKLGFCVQNAGKQIEKTNGKHYMVSGWAIGRYNKNLDISIVMHHFWNYDPDTGTHYDTTPDLDPDLDLEYVMHMDIGNYRVENKNDKFWLQPELAFSSNKIFITESKRIADGQSICKPMAELKLEEHNLQIDYLQLIDYYKTALKQRQKEAA